MKNKKEQKKQNRSGNKQPAKNAAPGKYYLALIAIAVLTIIVYFPSLTGKFVWDDDDYLRNNIFVHSFNLKAIFSNYVMGNYHPLTILAQAIQFHLFELSEKGYHVVNLMIHVLNAILVYYVIFRLSGNMVIALVASLLFGIHPLHVESVAWISELKDLLYTFFFLASYIYYLKFLDDKKRKFYFYSILFFLLSLLSKAMAASLPALLLLTDYFKGYKINTKSLVDKAPYFILALIFGIVAVFAQKTSGATDIAVFPIPQRILFASYGFLMYLVKSVVPINLCAYYAYPIKSGGSLPMQYFIYFLVVIGLISYVIYSLRKTKILFFGIGFFAVTVFLVLQLLPVGGAIMADRYAYIPSIGIFYLAGVAFYQLWNNRKFKSLAFVGLGAFVIFFSAQTYARCGDWKDGITLWNDVISKYQTIPQAYINRGIILAGQKKYDEALSDYNKAISIEPNFSKAYNNRGGLMRTLKKYEESIKDFDKAISLQPDYTIAFNNRGLLKNITQRYDEAVSDYSMAIQLKPDYTEAFLNRGIALRNLNRDEESMNDFNKALSLNPNYTKAFNERGTLYLKQQKYDLASSDYYKAIQLQPDYAFAYYNLGNLNMTLNKTSEAIQNFTRALELQPSIAEAYYYRGMSYYNSGNKQNGCKDLQQASSMGMQIASDNYNKFCR